MSDLFVDSTQDHQAKKLVDASPSVPQVESESRAAIGTRRKQMPGKGSREEWRLEQRGEGRSTLDPDRKWWHGEPGILSQQRHEARDIGLLPQGHIAVKQGCYMWTRAGSGGSISDIALLHSASGPLQGGIDGGNGKVEPLGYFGGWPLQHLAQEQNSPLHWR